MAPNQAEKSWRVPEEVTLNIKVISQGALEEPKVHKDTSLNFSLPPSIHAQVLLFLTSKYNSSLVHFAIILDFCVGLLTGP